MTLSASGGAPPYHFDVAGGALPAGLSLSPHGQLTGTPSKSGTFSFTARVTDAASGSATAGAKVTIYSALKLTSACAGRCYIGTGCTKCGGFGTASAGLGPYSYKTLGGSAPSNVSALSLTGAPTKPGSFSLTVQVSDALGGSGTVQSNWTIYGPATLTSGGDCVDTSDYPPFCNLRWTYAGGNPSTAPKLVILGYLQNCNVQGVCSTPTAPPPGWKVGVSGGVVTISASGSGCVTSYIGTVRLALVDPSACATTAQSNEQDLKVDLEYAC